jgi:WD40 repeat protein
VRNDWDSLTGQVGQVAFSPVDSTVLVGAGANAWVLSTEPARPPQLLHGHTDLVRAVDFTADGQRALTAGWDGRCLVWSTIGGSWSVIRALTNHPAPVTDAAFGPDELRVLTTSTNRAFVWSLPNGEEDARLSPRLSDGDEVQCGAFSPDGLLVALGTRFGSLSVWRWAARELLWELRSTNGPAIHDVRFADQGLQLVTAGADGRLLRWTTGEVSQRLAWRPTALVPAHATNLPSTPWTSARTAACSQRQRRSPSRPLGLGHRHTPPLNRHPDSVKSVAFHPGGRQFLAGTFDGRAPRKPPSKPPSSLGHQRPGAPVRLNPPGSSGRRFPAKRPARLSDTGRAAFGFSIPLPHGDHEPRN